MDLQSLYEALRNKRKHITIRTMFKSPTDTGIITRSTSAGQVITEERPVERQSRTGEDLTPLPLFGSHPNKYAGKKFCRSCKTWKLLTQFSPRAEMADGKHSYCRDCRSAKARQNYNATYRWKRG